MKRSLTWVERLSDNAAGSNDILTIEFQSLTWVERLSDEGAPVR